MRTLVLSDLHLGCGADPGIFAGAHSLPGLLTRLAAAPLRVVLNGDTFDFSAQDGAGDVAYALAQDPTNAAVLTALGRVLDRGGELIFRGGRNDAELMLAAVQSHVLRGLQVPARAERRVTFAAADEVTTLTVGAARVVVRHALHGGDPGDHQSAHALVNSLRRQFGVGLADLLRADPPAAALAGLAVNPTAARYVLRDLPAAADTLRALRASGSFARAGLAEREAQVLLAALVPDVILGSVAYDDGALRRARVKLLRASVGAAAPTGLYPRDVTADEWADALALVRDDAPLIVIGGHTHAAGWRAEPRLVACDTGAWTWLAQVPEVDSADERWESLLDRWQRSPRIDARLSGMPPTCLRFTAALIAASTTGRGVQAALIEWREDAVVHVREQTLTCAAAPRSRGDRGDVIR